MKRTLPQIIMAIGFGWTVATGSATAQDVNPPDRVIPVNPLIVQPINQYNQGPAQPQQRPNPASLPAAQQAPQYNQGPNPAQQRPGPAALPPLQPAPQNVQITNQPQPRLVPEATSAVQPMPVHNYVTQGTATATPTTTTTSCQSCDQGCQGQGPFDQGSQGRGPLADGVFRQTQGCEDRTINCMNSKGLGCMASHNSHGCTNCYANYIFVFGSCREFFTETCTPPPATDTYFGRFLKLCGKL